MDACLGAKGSCNRRRFIIGFPRGLLCLSPVAFEEVSRMDLGKHAPLVWHGDSKLRVVRDWSVGNFGSSTRPQFPPGMCHLTLEAQMLTCHNLRTWGCYDWLSQGRNKTINFLGETYLIVLEHSQILKWSYGNSPDESQHSARLMLLNILASLLARSPSISM